MPDGFSFPPDGFSLTDEINSLKLTKEISSITNSNQTNILEQNIPNPFNTETRISFSLDNSFSNASIIVYNLQGAQLKSYEIEKGSLQIIIKSPELNPGIYFYSLISDGKVIDTKRMVLTE